MAEHAATHEHQEHAHHHGGGIAKYIYVFIALCVLTTASFFTYSEWWRDNFSVQAGRTLMMIVSCTKALLVILFFMHVKYEANWKYVLTIPASFMAVFLGLALIPDVGLRDRHASEEARQHMASPTQFEKYNSKALEDIEQHDPLKEDHDKKTE